VAATIAHGELLKDRYRLERLLGRGGMAAVWLGHDEVLDRPVAVKVLADTIASDPGFLARFRREAKTVAGLSHPNLVAVYDFSEEDERPYLVMQFVPGDDLAARLEREELFDCDQLAVELLDALSHIHAVGILHRDVKPANVIVEPDGTAKLIDFGIALPRDATSLTHTGLVLGTERYSAPEVLEGRPATERSDLYSCGVVLRACEGDRSPALEDLVDALTAADPRDRPLSAEDAIEALDPAVIEEAVIEPPTEEATRQMPIIRGNDGGQPGGERPDRRKVVAVLLGAVAVLIVVAALALSGGGGSDSGGGQPAQAKAEKRQGASPQPAAVEEPEQSEPEPAESEPEATSPPEEEIAPDPNPSPDPGRAVTLNDEGFALIQAGEPEAAVPILEEAVASFPEGTGDLNYAYALYNLGNALRLSGRPAEAIPILERRLEIPDQENAVLSELEAAREEAARAEAAD